MKLVEFLPIDEMPGNTTSKFINPHYVMYIVPKGTKETIIGFFGEKDIIVEMPLIDVRNMIEKGIDESYIPK